MWAVLSPFPSKREGDGSLFCALTKRKCFLRLSMISWGQFYVTERFCDFLLLHNLLIKLQPWLTFLWTTFCPFFLKNNSYYNLFFSYDKLLIFLYFRVCPSRIIKSVFIYKKYIWATFEELDWFKPINNQPILLILDGQTLK